MKKFGKLRQWTDEKLGTSQKTIATEEFRDLEAEMMLRQQGLEAILTAITQWMRALGKKKEGQDKEKGTPLDLLGIAMFQHSEDFSAGSAYGQGLKRLGIAQQQIARAQDIFQQTVSDVVIMNMEKSLVAMKDYQAARKKLESRRLTYDSTLSRMHKTKKEDLRLEEELRVATARYEETSDEVHTRMMSIREAEQSSLTDLTRLIDAETEYFSQAQGIMLCLQQSLSTESGHLSVKKSSLSASVPAIGDRTAAPCRVMSQSYASMPSLHKICDQDELIVARKPRTSVVMANQSSEQLAEHLMNGLHHRRKPELKDLTTDTTHQATMKHRKVVANFAFDAENSNEMSLQPGDLIVVLEEVTEGWWQGQIQDPQGNLGPRKGLFPANYCSPYTDPFPLTSSSERLVPEPDGCAKGLSSQATSSAEAAGHADRTATRGKPPPPPVPKKKVSAFQRIPSSTGLSSGF